jgi:copper chaperone CopZ
MSALLVLLIVNGYFQRWKTRKTEQRKNATKTQEMKSNIHVFKVEGMTCSHCKASVERGLSQLSQVTEVVADPGRNTVTVEAGTLDDERVKATVEQLGYIFQGRA